MLTHRDDCTGAVLTHFVGIHGDVLVKCRHCRATAIADDTEAERKPARRAFIIPRCPTGQRFGDQWPTHRGKRRHTSTRWGK